MVCNHGMVSSSPQTATGRIVDTEIAELVWYGMVDVCAGSWRFSRPGTRFLQKMTNFYFRLFSRFLHNLLLEFENQSVASTPYS